LAFPNAYVETDEPHIRSPLSRLSRILAITGTAYFGLTILVLTLFDSDYSPVAQAASDYGVGRFAFEMNLGFLIGGVGLLSYAIAINSQDAKSRTRAGAVLFLIAGAVLIMDSYFTTNVEGGSQTLHGLIHGLGGFVFFITAPIGTLLVARKFGRVRVFATILMLGAGFFLLAANVNAGGLAERVILLVIFASVMVTSASFT